MNTSYIHDHTLFKYLFKTEAPMKLRENFPCADFFKNCNQLETSIKLLIRYNESSKEIEVFCWQK